MLFRETVAVHSYNTEHINTVCEHRAEQVVHMSLRIYFQLFTIHHATVSRFKTVTALHVWAYLAILRYAATQGNCRAFCTTAIGVFVFTGFLNEANVIPSFMPHVLTFLGRPLAYQVCSVDVIWY
jgi:hypothetical protein